MLLHVSQQGLDVPVFENVVVWENENVLRMRPAKQELDVFHQPQSGWLLS